MSHPKARNKHSKRGNSYNNNLASHRQNKEQITFLLLESTKVGVVIPYVLMNKEVKGILQKNEAIWSPDFRNWMIPMQSYKDCCNEISRFFENNQIEQRINKIPDFVFRARNQIGQYLSVKNRRYSLIQIPYSCLETSIDPSSLPFFDKLYDFQKQSLRFGIQKHGRLLLADEMGVGKTIQSIAIAYIYKHQWPLLIICPSALRLNWESQILKWLKGCIDKAQIQIYLKKGVPIRKDIKIFIVSYDSAWKLRDQLEGFEVVIADEAHYLKNSGNKRSDILVPFLSCRKRVIILTGTPAFAKPRQIYNLLSIIRPDVFTNFTQFGNRYCQPKINQWSRALEYNGCKNSKELNFIIKGKMMIRRLKSEVLTQLPSKQRQKIIVESDKKITQEIKDLMNPVGGEKTFQRMVMDILNGHNNNQDDAEDTRKAITKAYTLTGLAKLNSVKQYIMDLLQNSIKLIVFAHHQQVLNGLEAVIKPKYQYIRIDGSTQISKRQQFVEDFQKKQNVLVALLSITAAGVGFTLTAASTVVFCELHWTPGVMVQAEDRAHRIGQKSSVNCHYLIGENTLDDMLYRYLEKKVNNVSEFVDGRRENLDMEELEKGVKGKVSKSNNATSSTGLSRQSLLFKFQSSRQMLQKYEVQKSQDTQIQSDKSDGTLTQRERSHRKKKILPPDIPDVQEYSIDCGYNPQGLCSFPTGEDIIQSDHSDEIGEQSLQFRLKQQLKTNRLQQINALMKQDSNEEEIRKNKSSNFFVSQEKEQSIKPDIGRQMATSVIKSFLKKVEFTLQQNSSLKK